MQYCVAAVGVDDRTATAKCTVVVVMLAVEICYGNVSYLAGL